MGEISQSVSRATKGSHGRRSRLRGVAKTATGQSSWGWWECGKVVRMMFNGNDGKNGSHFSVPPGSWANETCLEGQNFHQLPVFLCSGS